MKSSREKISGEVHSTSKDAPSCESQSVRTLSPDSKNFSKGSSNMETSNAATATRVVSSCFKGTSLRLKVLPACCPTLPPLNPNNEHTVMFKVPTKDGVCPQPDPDEYCDLWDCDHVQMPCSPESKCENAKDMESRWELIKESLSVDIKSSHDLEEAILKYNRQFASRWNFSGLHLFFKEVLSAEETAKFFQSTLPAMIDLALSLPQICTQPIPFLKQEMNHAITFTQKQISCLLCHAFLCTFPREKKISSKGSQKAKTIKFSSYPNICFNKLYAGAKNNIASRKAGKLKCLINYFSRVTTKEPTGTVTFRRQSIHEPPKWSSSQKDIKSVGVNSDGVIEADGLGMLQVDFADKFVGGYVLDYGCVQEEIRFVICPELIVSRLFTECLGAAEVLLISGAEQYNKYKGYADSFLWNGDFQDQTPRDDWGRRCTRVVAMDALYFRNPADQFRDEHLLRELNKAYCGFYDSEIPTENLPAVATGNWGCGVFKGNPHFKFLIQLMAASEAGRDILYFTFHSGKLQEELENMYRLVLKRKLKVGDIWSLLVDYDSSRQQSGKAKETKFYDFVCSALMER